MSYGFTRWLNCYYTFPKFIFIKFNLGDEYVGGCWSKFKAFLVPHVFAYFSCWRLYQRWWRETLSHIFTYIPCIRSRQRCFIKKVFLKILQNSQEKTCARVSFSIKLQATGRTPLVAASRLLQEPWNYLQRKTSGWFLYECSVDLKWLRLGLRQPLKSVFFILHKS